MAQVDTVNASEVVDYVAGAAHQAGRVDIALNAIGIPAVQGVPLLDLSLADFLAPISA